MMTFYTGRDAKVYDKKFNFIKRTWLKSGEIRPTNPNKANAETFRHMVDKVYLALLNKKIEKNQEKKQLGSD